MENPDSALEQFRQQWREEVSARAISSKKRQSESDGKVHHNGPSYPPRGFKPSLSSPGSTPGKVESREERGNGSHAEQRWQLAAGLDRLSVGGETDEQPSGTAPTEPESALEHYERAVEKENEGNLGASLSHYRKAYRLDDCVDQIYKRKHFPTYPKPDDINPSAAPVTVPSTAHHSSKELPLSTSIFAVILGFASLPIPRAAPIIEGDNPPPCPIANLPPEILFDILLSTARSDPASFARLALVCRRLAYHVFMENQIWKRVALGLEFGLAGQVYDFKTDIRGNAVINRALDPTHIEPGIVETVFGGSINQDWREVFHTYPRVRYTGVYISTVNYTRPGGASLAQVSWNSPVLIVTYYRYLRFFRDGTVISLLSTSAPTDVVPHLTRENMSLVRGGKEHNSVSINSSAPANSAAQTPGPLQTPAAHQLMKHALRGRWRLCCSSDAERKAVADTATAGIGSEGEILIETEGAGPRYTYTMQLVLRSSGKSKHGVKNNKLQWKGFWSYNHVTDDWAPFQLKHDRAWFFSRVRSYGLGY